MAEYLKITNNDGYVIIDDAFQNYHYLNKVSTKFSAFTDSTRFSNNNTGYYIIEYAITITSAVQPLVALRCQNSDPSMYNISYRANGNNSWTAIVFTTKRFKDNYPNMDVVFYVFGLLPPNTPHSTGAVFQVKNAAGHLIFDSGRRPMKVVGYRSGFRAPDWVQPAPGQIPASFSTLTWNIPNYDANKVYAIINNCHIFTTMYQDPNVFRSFISYTWRSNNQIKIDLTLAGQTFILDSFGPYIEAIVDSFTLIDVTNY